MKQHLVQNTAVGDVTTLYCSSSCALHQYGLLSAKTCCCINCINIRNSCVKVKIVCNIETLLLSSRHAQWQILFYNILLRSLSNRCGQSRVSTVQQFSCCKQLNILNICGRKDLLNEVTSFAPEYKTTAVYISLIWISEGIFPLYFSHSSFLVNKCGWKTWE